MSEEKQSYQICELDEFLQTLENDNGYTSPEDYMKTIEPIKKAEPMPDDYIIAESTIDVPKSHEGEISKILRTAPGILPPTDRISNLNSYQNSNRKQLKQPDFIPSGIGNAIPILLSEKFFKMPEMIVNMNITNDLDKSCSGNSRRNDSSGYSNDNSFEQRFSTVFIDDNSSDDCNVHQEPIPKPKPVYYTPKQIYAMKRGKKN